MRTQLRKLHFTISVGIWGEDLVLKVLFRIQSRVDLFLPRVRLLVAFRLCAKMPLCAVTAHSLEAVKDIFTSTIPLRRMGKPEDVAGTALFLASPAGAFVNGATITLDGGMLVSMTKL